jgi:nicotinate phosphoribosyltransferase
LLLVDTVNTLESGVPNAIRVFEELRQKGHRPVGIRLDSGDLAYLSVQSAKMLDAAGFPDTQIVLSNQLDELTILQILAQIEDEAPRYGLDADHLVKRLVYGVGTNLITSAGDAALDGVYKLVAVQSDDGRWTPAIKISENPAKTPNPGLKQVWRVYDRRGQATADLLSLHDEDPQQMRPLVHAYWPPPIFPKLNRCWKRCCMKASGFTHRHRWRPCAPAPRLTWIVWMRGCGGC